MKQTLLSLVFALFAVGAYAQADQTFIFVDKDGNEIADGSIVNVTEAEEDIFTGGVVMHSGLFIKYNGDGNDNDVFAGMKINITAMDNGSLQHCFPGSCMFYSNAGEYIRPEAATINAGTNTSINSEWSPTDKGMCTVTYTIRVMAKAFGSSYIETATGPSVTVNYCNGVPVPEDAIRSVSGNAHQGKTYNLNGQEIGQDQHGVVIRDGKKILK